MAYEYNKELISVFMTSFYLLCALDYNQANHLYLLKYL